MPTDRLNRIVQRTQQLSHFRCIPEAGWVLRSKRDREILRKLRCGFPPFFKRIEKPFMGSRATLVDNLRISGPTPSQ